jgi:hypothetical protein
MEEEFVPIVDSLTISFDHLFRTDDEHIPEIREFVPDLMVSYILMVGCRGSLRIVEQGNSCLLLIHLYSISSCV